MVEIAIVIVSALILVICYVGGMVALYKAEMYEKKDSKTKEKH